MRHLRSVFAALCLVSLISALPLQSAHALNSVESSLYTDSRRPVGPGTAASADQSGAFVYTYDLPVPPGRNGQTPSLALNYSSADTANTNIAGYGWSLAIPTISRLNKTGVNMLYTSTYFTSSLSGELVPITLTDGSHGTYGPRIETGDFLLYSFNTDNSWTVVDKKGETYTFGQTTASRTDNPANTSQIYSWSLSSERDTHGNAITYIYTKDNNYLYPQQIRYSDVVSLATGAVITPGAITINFVYETRQDQMTNYASAFLVKTAQRLHEIRTEVTVPGTSQPTWVKKYTLNYVAGDNTARSLLANITETGRDETTSVETVLSPTSFVYSTSTPSFTQSATYTDSLRKFIAPFSDVYHNGRDGGMRLFDTDSDGLPEIYWGWDTWQTSLGDCFASGVPWPYEAYLGEWGRNTGVGWTTPAQSTYSVPIIQHNGDYLGSDTGQRHIDINGDGMLDFVCSGTWVPGNSPREYHNVTNFSEPTPSGPSMTGHVDNEIPGSFIQYSGTGDVNPRSLFYGDFTGDGLLDFITNTDGHNTNIYFNTGTSTNWWEYASNFIGPSTVNFYYGPGPNTPTIVDLNGDSLDDFIDGSGPALNTGTNFVLSPDLYMPTSTLFSSDSALSVVDINGDGLVDTVPMIATNNTYAYLNTGVSDAASAIKGWRIVNGYQLPNEAARTTQSYDNGLRFGDVNGDGLADILVYRKLDQQYFSDYYYRYHIGSSDFVYPRGQYYAAVYLHDGHIPDHMIAVNASSGARTAVSYARTTQFTNPILYTPMDVVSEITTTDTFAPTNRVTYRYDGGKWHWDSPSERKFAGFQTVTKVENNARTTKTFYHQADDTDTVRGEYNDSWSKIGQPYRVEVTDANNQLLSTQIIKWDEVNLGTNRNYVKKVQAVSMNYNPGTTVHVDTVETWGFATTTGNLLEDVTYGEVSATNAGTFTDMGTDLFRTTYGYAVDTNNLVRGAVAQEETKDYTNTRVRLTNHYYDNQLLRIVTRGNETRSEKLMSGAGYQGTNRVFNTLGLVTSEIDPRGNATSYIYDAAAMYPTTVTNALGQTTQYVYDYSAGKPVTVIDPNGGRSETQYDGFDRGIAARQSVTSGGATELISQTFYNDTPQPRSVREVKLLDTDTNGVEGITYLDGLNRTIQTRQEAPGVDTYTVRDVTYDLFGRKLTESLPYTSAGVTYTPPTTVSNLLTTYTYDALNRPTTIATVLGTTSKLYDSWTVTTTDALGNVTGLLSDAYGRLREAREKNGATIYRNSYIYDGNNALVTMYDQLGNVRTFTVDYVGRRTRSNDVRSGGDTTVGFSTYVYDNANNVTTEVTPRGDSIVYTYDALNRLIRETVNAAQPPAVTYVYDNCTNGIGRLCSVVTSDIITAYTYDATGRITQETKTIAGQIAPFITTYSYNRQGNVITQTTNGQTVINTFGNAGQVQSIAANNLPVVTDVSYSPLGQITSIGYANNTRSTNTFDPNVRYRLTQKQTVNQSAVNLQQVGYTYDAVGNILTMNDTSANALGKLSTYTYDPLYRLTQAVISNTANNANYTQNFTYNAVGNILTGPAGTYLYQGNTIAGSYANPHAVTSVGGVAKTYDQNGNMTTDSFGHTYAWDYRSRLTQSTLAPANTVTRYAYDQNNDRIKTTAADGVITFYPNKMFEVTGSTTTLRVTLGDGEVASIVTGPTQTNRYFTHTDHLGGTAVVTDEAGNSIELIDYQPFGKVRVDQTVGNQSSVEKKKFTGYKLDDETGLYYANARYYDPAIGRFMSEDPVAKIILPALIIDPQQMNMYAYGRNNPVRFTDTLGMSSSDFQSTAEPKGGYQYGDLFGTYKGVEVHSAGASTGGIKHPYQCVTFVKEVMKKLYDISLDGNGAGYTYGDESKLNSTLQKNNDNPGSFKVTENGGETMPKTDDIISWTGNGAGHESGHVGIISDVHINEKTGKGTVTTVEQNQSKYKGTFTRQITRTDNSKTLFKNATYSYSLNSYAQILLKPTLTYSYTIQDSSKSYSTNGWASYTAPAQTTKKTEKGK